MKTRRTTKEAAMKTEETATPESQAMEPQEAPETPTNPVPAQEVINSFAGYAWRNQITELSEIIESAIAAAGKCTPEGRIEIAKTLKLPECTPEALTQRFVEQSKVLHTPNPQLWELLAVRDVLQASARVLARERGAKDVARAMSSNDLNFRKTHAPWLVDAGDVILRERKAIKAAMRQNATPLKNLGDLFA